MNKIILIIWRIITGPLQWKVLWLAHSKFIVGVAAVVLNDKKEILLLQHTYWPKGSWGLPGGYTNSGEKLESTIERELQEETGLKVEVDSLIKINSGYKLRIETYYLARLIGGKLKLNSREVITTKFFSHDNLPDGILENHQEAIRSVFENS